MGDLVSAEKKEVKISFIRLLFAVIKTIITAAYGAFGAFLVIYTDIAEDLIPNRYGRSALILLGVIALILGWDQFLRTWYYAHVFFTKGTIVEYKVCLSASSKEQIEHEFEIITSYMESLSRPELGRRLLRDCGVCVFRNNSEIFDVFVIHKKDSVIRLLERSGKPVCIYEVSAYFPKEEQH